MADSKTSDKQETPRTDALELALYQADSCLVTEPTFPEMMDFTRQLERELAEAHREIQRICQKQADADNEREQTVSARGDIERAAMAMEMYLVESGQTPHYAKLIADQRIRNLK